MLNTVLFPLSSGISSASQDLVTRFLRLLYVTTLNSYGSFFIAEVLLIFSADSFVFIPLVGKQITPPVRPDP